MCIKTKNDWSFRFFNNPDYLNIYDSMTGPERTETELNFCERVLRWKIGQFILDAPCGAGRHTNVLAKQGHTICGLDFSTYLLGQAQTAFSLWQSDAGAPNYTRGLLQELPYAKDRFDFIICLFSSFGYGEKEEENLQVMREFARVLRPGGKVLIDVMNRHFLVPRLNAVFESTHADLFVREERSITDNGRRLHNCIKVRDKQGNKRQYLYRPWLFNGWELSWLAAQVGLKVEGIYGNFYADKYQQNSERAMLVAMKQ